MRRWGLVAVAVAVLACAGCGGGSSGPTLTIVLAGTASEGSVISTAGLDCGSDCAVDVPPGVIVPISVVVPRGVQFMGWDGGGCTGTVTDCMVTVTDDVTVTATFDQRLEYIDRSATTYTALDILLVNDDSGSTAEQQATLNRAFPTLMETVAESAAGMPSLHIGVVTSDMGSGGVDTGDPSCNDSDGGSFVKGNPDLPADPCPQVSGNFLSVDGATTNFTGTLADAFTCMSSVYSNGCGFEQHLESMRAALDDNPANVGFLRADALLAVIINADEDDCSAMNPALFGPDSAELGPLDSFRCFEKGVRCAEGRDVDLRAEGPKTDCVPDDASEYLYPVSHYVDFLRGLKTDPRGVIVAVMAGDPAPVEVGRRTPANESMSRPDLVPSCQYTDITGNTKTADPGIRLNALADAFGAGRGIAVTECAGDYTDDLTRIGRTIRDALGYECLDDELYAPDACTLAYSTGTPIELCNAALDNQPCWHVVVDAAACPASRSNQHLIIEGPSVPGAYISGTCRIN